MKSVRDHLLNSRISLAQIDTSNRNPSTYLENAVRETNAAINALTEALNRQPEKRKHDR